MNCLQLGSWDKHGQTCQEILQTLARLLLRSSLSSVLYHTVSYRFKKLIRLWEWGIQTSPNLTASCAMLYSSPISIFLLLFRPSIRHSLSLQNCQLILDQRPSWLWDDPNDGLMTTTGANSPNKKGELWEIDPIETLKKLVILSINLYTSIYYTWY